MKELLNWSKLCHSKFAVFPCESNNHKQRRMDQSRIKPWRAVAAGQGVEKTMNEKGTKKLMSEKY